VQEFELTSATGVEVALETREAVPDGWTEDSLGAVETVRLHESRDRSRLVPEQGDREVVEVGIGGVPQIQASPALVLLGLEARQWIHEDLGGYTQSLGDTDQVSALQVHLAGFAEPEGDGLTTHTHAAGQLGLG
jgi:hypothetical protein